MTDKAILSTTDGAQPQASALDAASVHFSFNVEAVLPQGVLVGGDVTKLSTAQIPGLRVKLLRNTNLLTVGSYTIDIEKNAPKVPETLEVPADVADSWPHYLVQLNGLRSEVWNKLIEGADVTIVEPISAYGLLVECTPSQAKALSELAFVQWVGEFKPAYKLAPNLDGLSGKVSLGIGLTHSGGLGAVTTALKKYGATLETMDVVPGESDGGDAVIRAIIDAKHIPGLATMPEVRWIEHQPPMVPFGEREVQILAENVNATAAPNTGVPTGYAAWLTGVGLSGAGTTVAIVDTGVDANANNNASGHTDVRGRQVAFVDYTAGNSVSDTNGHGSHVAGIAVGNAATGQTEGAAPNNFLWGQGTAPQASYVTQNFLLANPQPSTQTLIQDATTNGANVMNNSWGVDNSGGSGYTGGCRTIDQRVRDPDTGAAGLENLVVICAAGNEGGRNGSISTPHETKNDIIVGNSLTWRPGASFPADDIRGIAGTSGRGLAADGRILPTVVAPGTDVSSVHSRTSARVPIAGTGAPDPANPANTINQYTTMSGTSQAAPHVSGACALLIEWWRNRTNSTPSPALLKALLINGAEDLGGGQNWRCLSRVTVDKAAWTLQAGNVYRRNMAFVPAAIAEGTTILTQVGALANLTAAGQWFFDNATNRLFVWMVGGTNPSNNNAPFVHARDTQPVPNIPNGHQGWGRVSLRNMLLQSPGSDRGPRIFSDQRHAFTGSGQQHMIRVAPTSAQPMRITLVWTDAAGAANANPALVNDLDLEVTELSTGNVYRGNVFNNGFSVVGGAFDGINNTECVYLQNPAGTYEVRVIAASITASARPDIPTPWQDFALVIENAEVPATTPVNVAVVLDRSGSMVFSGYEALTRTSSKQFIDLMSLDDNVAVVSFGSTSTVEYPTGANPVLQQITGQPTRDAAKAEIDGIGFGGCTFMGAGITAARDLLAPAAAGQRAMVLLSDGYDNKGCDQGNPAKPSALEAVATLPGSMPIYACAMGPASDQTLLEQLATTTLGRYYYMPTIDDLFEIYNYIRGQVTGDGIIVNTSAMASASSVSGFVDAAATRATFSVAWANTKLHYTPGDPKKANEVSIRLRDPKGRLVHPHASHVRRIVGAGYVAFELHEPLPGLWRVEVSTAGDTHVRYTVGGFVDSPLRLVLSYRPFPAIAGVPLQFVTSVLDGKEPVLNYRGSMTIVQPAVDFRTLLMKLKPKWKNLESIAGPGGDGFPVDYGKLLKLREQQLKLGKPDLFQHTTTVVALKNPGMGDVLGHHFGASAGPTRVGHGLGTLTPMSVATPAAATHLATHLPGILRRGVPSAHTGLPVLTHAVQPPLTVSALDLLPGLRLGKLINTHTLGSRNVTITVQGMSPGSRTRFVRQDLVSVVLK